MKVRDIMTEKVVYAEIPGSRVEALELILKHDISGIPVVKRGTKDILGIVTRNDFAKNPEEEQLALLMTSDVQTISPNADVREAARIFHEGKFRRLPVVDDSTLVGIVTLSDVVWRYITKSEIKEPVENYIVSRITTIWEGTPLKVAYKIMGLSGERALAVLDDEGKLSGMLGDYDLLKVLNVSESTVKSELSGGTEGDRWGWDSKNIVYITKKKLEFPAKSVAEIMAKDLVTATRKTAVSEAARRMSRSKIEQIPVINAEGDLIGIIRDTDTLKAIV